MAYTDTKHTHKSLAGVSGVALIHIALAFGLAAGLTITYTPPEPPIIIEGRTVVDLPPPPPPDDVVETTEITERIVEEYSPPIAPPVEIDLTSAHRVVIGEIPPLVPVERIVPEAVGSTVPRDPVQPVHVPTDAVPTNGPTGWVTTNDYPSRALMRGWEGDLTYALDISANGRVEDCRVINSSGRSILDREACRVIKQRARFDPATDSSGSTVAGSYRGAVSWIIPDD